MIDFGAVKDCSPVNYRIFRLYSAMCRYFSTSENMRSLPAVIYRRFCSKIEKSHNISVIAFSYKTYFTLQPVFLPSVCPALRRGNICLSPCPRLLSALFGSQSAPFSSLWCVPHTLSVSRWLSVSDNFGASGVGSFSAIVGGMYSPIKLK